MLSFKYGVRRSRLKNLFSPTFVRCKKNVYVVYFLQWFSLLHPDNTLFLDSFRECYEAYVIYSFMMFLSNYLRERYGDIEDTISNKPQVSHLFPLCFLKEWRMGK